MTPYLLISRVQVIGANAMNGMYSVGAPAMTSILGCVHALQRKINEQGLETIRLPKAAISFHEFDQDVRFYKFKRKKTGVIVTGWNLEGKLRSPIIDGKELKNASFVEEPECRFLCSLLIQADNVNAGNEEKVLVAVKHALNTMRLAGGSIISFKGVKMLYIDENNQSDVRKALCTLMPGNVLIERTDLLKNEKNPVKKIVDILKFKKTKTKTGIVKYHKRDVAGWIVPMAVGYKALSGYLENNRNSRDRNCKTRIAETVMTTCEFKMPFVFDSIDEIMWRYEVNKDQGLYLCKNN